MAAGPDFRKQFVDSLPSGNIDVAPTILSILGVQPSDEVDGRVLNEALATPATEESRPITVTMEATAIVKGIKWHQYLRTHRLGRQTYLDEGNGEAAAGPATASHLNR